MSEKPERKSVESNVMCQCGAYGGKPHRLGAPLCDPSVWVSEARSDRVFWGSCDGCNLNDGKHPEPCAWIRGQESFKTAKYYCEILRLVNGGTIPKRWYPRRGDNMETEYCGGYCEQDPLDFIESKFYGGKPMIPANTEPEEGLEFKCITGAYDCVFGLKCPKEKACANLNDKESSNNSGTYKNGESSDYIPFD